ncbi:unnamed protein product, partial [Discosporangium mesarthrocarpum]
NWRPTKKGQGSWEKSKEKGKSRQPDPPVWRVELGRGVCTGEVEISQPLGMDLVDTPDMGVCVSKVHPGGSAERMGVRPGDRVVATSATLGNGLWEKNTVDGVLSAVGTRLVLSDTVTLRLERGLESQQVAEGFPGAP